MSDLITVIVPVYNGEKCIEKCIDSILNQTYENIEILIINDGSTDSTKKIVQRYVEQYDKVRVIHKENAGLPQARKTGIENAQGTYIGFVDADDWIEPEMYEILHGLCVKNQADISACGLYLQYGSKKIEQFTPSEAVTIYDNIEAMLQVNKRKNIQSYAWNKLYKKYVFNGVNFGTDNFIGEDYDILMQVLGNTNKLVWIAQSLYHYVQSDVTMCRSGFSNMHLHSYNMLSKRCRELIGRYPENKEYYENYVLTEYLMFVVAMSRNSNYDYNLLNQIKKDIKCCRKQYCRADYIELKFKLSINAFCIHYKLFIWGYRLMEKIRYIAFR